MADIDFITDLRSGFEISLTNNPQKVVGNRALLNHFEITFLTQAKIYLMGDDQEGFLDNFGGNASALVTRPQVINDPEGIVSAITICIERTVQSVLQDQPEDLPNTEKLDSAALLNVDVLNGIIYAKIQVIPVETENYASLVTNLPVIKRS